MLVKGPHFIGQKVEYTTIQKFGVSKILLKKLIIYSELEHIKLIKSDSKDIYNLTKTFCFK